MKNTVCLLLKCCPPGINPEFMMECKLIAHPIWQMHSKKLFGINTLSWNEKPTRLRPEWPWRARRYRISCLDGSVQYWYRFLFPATLPCFSSICRQTNDDNAGNISEDNLLISRIQSLHHLLEVDHHDEEEWSVASTLDNRWANNLVVQNRSKFFPQWVQFLWMSWQKKRLCGFALAFDRLPKANTFDFNGQSSNCISEVSCSLSSCSLLLKSVTNLFKSWEILTHESEWSLLFRLNSNLHSIFTL